MILFFIILLLQADGDQIKQRVKASNRGRQYTPVSLNAKARFLKNNESQIYAVQFSGFLILDVEGKFVGTVIDGGLLTFFRKAFSSLHVVINKSVITQQTIKSDTIFLCSLNHFLKKYRDRRTEHGPR